MNTTLYMYRIAKRNMCVARGNTCKIGEYMHEYRTGSEQYAVIYSNSFSGDQAFMHMYTNEVRRGGSKERYE